MGSLVQHGRDPSGHLYRRNRYYDPATGRFTQEDPIGLGGGVNLYGFADGDPVTYGDPFGFCKTLPDGSTDPECERKARDLERTKDTLNRRINEWNEAVRTGTSSLGHLRAVSQARVPVERLLRQLENCDDDDDFKGLRDAAAATLAQPIQRGPGQYPDKRSIPRVPRSPSALETAGWTTLLVTAVVYGILVGGFGN